MHVIELLPLHQWVSLSQRSLLGGDYCIRRHLWQLSVITEGGIFQIVNSNMNQPVSTSELTVSVSTVIVWRYCCQASLLGVTGTAVECVIPTKLTQ